MLDRTRSLLFSLLASLALAGCGPDEHEQQILDQASRLKSELENLSADLGAAESDLTGFLVSDPRARVCQVENEANALKTTFGSIDSELSSHIAQVAALAETAKPDPAFTTADAEISAHQQALDRNKQALAGATDLGRLLRESIADRDAFKKRADKAWFRTLRASDSIIPWYNRQKEMGGETASAATSRMDGLLTELGEAKRLYGGIEAGFTAAKRGDLYNCSIWAVSVVRMERVAETIESKTVELEKLWKPAP